MIIEDILLNKSEYLPVDVYALIEDSAVPEFVEIDDLELFEAIKPALKKHLDCNGYGPACLSFENSVAGEVVLKDAKRYINLKMRIKNFQDGNESSIDLTIHPFACYMVYGKNVFEITAEKEISRAVRKFLSQKLSQRYVDENNEYFAYIKNEKTEAIRAEAENKINNVRDEYLENIII